MMLPRVSSLLCCAVCLALFAAPNPVSAAEIEVRSCGATLAAPGDYVLAQDIGPCPGAGIVITASEVRLRLAGRRITGMSDPSTCNRGQPQIGIDIRAGTEFVEVTGGTVTRFTHGMNIAGSGSGAQSVRLLDNCSSGATVAGDLNGLSRLQVRGGDVGIRVTGSSNSVGGSEISDARQYGIEMVGASSTGNVLVVTSLLFDNGRGSATGAAIALTGGQDGAVDGNTLLNNGAGIIVTGSSANVVSANDIHGSTRAGIAVVGGATGNMLLFNVGRGNAVDLSEENECDLNQWSENDFVTSVGCVDRRP